MILTPIDYLNWLIDTVRRIRTIEPPWRGPPVPHSISMSATAEWAAHVEEARVCI